MSDSSSSVPVIFSGHTDQGEETLPGSTDPSPEVLLRIAENQDLRRSAGWQNREVTLTDFKAQLMRHRVAAGKFEVAVFVPGSLKADRRTASEVTELSAMVFDLDRAQKADEIRASLEAQRLHAIVYSTHSHGTRQTEVRLADYQKYAGGSGVTLEMLRRFLADVRNLTSDIADSAEIVTAHVDGPNGPVCVVQHNPISKFRVVLPLGAPFRLSDWLARGETQADYSRHWKAKYAAVARVLNLQRDRTCSDISRAFFMPSHPPGAIPFAFSVGGALLDLEDQRFALPTSTDTPPESGAAPRVHGYRGSRMQSHPELNLAFWIAQYGGTFEIETALRQRAPADIFGTPAAGGAGVHIRCPFEETHSSAGGSGTFVVNASGNDGRGCAIHCCHAHCIEDRGDGTRVDRIIFLERMIALRWLHPDDLRSPEYGGGDPSMRGKQRALHRDLSVVDRDGNGIDVGIFHATVIAPGLFDFARFNSRCNAQVSTDVTPEQLAAFIDSGRSTIGDLVACSNTASTSDDPYVVELIELARASAAEGFLAHQIEAQLQAIRDSHKVKQKTIESDFKRIQGDLASPSTRTKLGVLSAEEAALLTPLRNFVNDFAILNQGGKGVVLDLNQPDLSKATMAFDDFEKLHRNEWREVKQEDGSVRTVYPARTFITKPPRGTQVYQGGLVFKPSGTVAANQYNLYKGPQVKPDSSGSCSMFWDLLGEVWCQGDHTTSEYVGEWFMHVVAHPGDKIGTSLAVRGEPGDGKSIIFEPLLSKILGPTLLRVTNHNMILGSFNEALIGKLMTVIEEAAFSGDKKAFDQMKELITGDKVLINPKFKAPIVVDNFSRLVVISNHDHFLHIKPNDRRYTVLETTPAWNGTNKFEQLVEQWRNGGAERFVYEALNHSFRQVDDRKRLIIDTVLKTSASVRQMALSRSPLEQCIVQFLLTGQLKDRNGYPIVLGKGGVQEIPVWTFSSSLEIRSQDLGQLVRNWCADFDPVAARHDVTLHTIIATLQRYVGSTEELRPKGKMEGVPGRVQLPTVRKLPKRRRAIQEAFDKGLITDDEFRAATSEPGPTDPVRSEETVEERHAATLPP